MLVREFEGARSCRRPAAIDVIQTFGDPTSAGARTTQGDEVVEIFRVPGHPAPAASRSVAWEAASR